jgi:NAD(P)-dependent dehydrogenase (short-subunit alcohol dehydrogenase family)
MKKNNHGRIILFSTESALHGGSPFSLPYATGKLGIECLVKGFAREGAKFNITVNGIRPGFIASGFHERWQFKTVEDLRKRIDLVPMKRAGSPAEVADLIFFLLSKNAGYITGDTISISGGDWL